MLTLTLLVPSTRLPLSVDRRVTYFGTVAPSSGVWGWSTAAAVFELTWSGSSPPVQPSTATPARPSEAARASKSDKYRVPSHVLIASSLIGGQCTCRTKTVPLD